MIPDFMTAVLTVFAFFKNDNNLTLGPSGLIVIAYTLEELIIFQCEILPQYFTSQPVICSNDEDLELHNVLLYS